MGLTLITAPAALPVSRDDSKAQLRVDGNDDDALIDRLIATATGMLDGYAGQLGRALLTQTWRLDLDTFPDRCAIELPLPPLQQVLSVTYVDPTGATQTLSDQAFRVTGVGSYSRARISPALGTQWPVTARVPDAVSITFRAGFGNAPTDVPAPICSAILAVVASLYSIRETVILANVQPFDFPPMVDAIEQFAVSRW